METTATEKVETLETTSTPKTKKLNATDLDSINELRNKFNDLYSSIGLLTIDKNILTTQLETVETQISEKLSLFSELRIQEEQLIFKLKEQYGDGQINILEGTFTSAE